MESALLLLPDGQTLVVALVIVLVASAVQAVLGMGYGMVASPLLALLDPVFVPVSTIMIGFVSASLVALSARREIAVSQFVTGSLGRVIGVALALLVMLNLGSQRHYLLVFGCLTGVAVLLSVAGIRLPLNRLTLVLMAGISGLMGTITGVGAPPMAVIYQDQPARSARPTLAAFFALGCLVSVLALGWAGRVQMRDFVICLIMIPSVLIGTTLGQRFGPHGGHWFRPAVLGVAAVSSLLLVGKAVWLSD